MGQYNLRIEPQNPPITTNEEVWNFASAPYLHPMKVKINLKKSGTASGLIFVAPYALNGSTMIGQTGALIMDLSGNPVWFNPLSSTYIQNTDFKVQSYKGEPVLTMWEGTISGTQTSSPTLPVGDPEPYAYYLILNQNYNIIRKIYAKRGYTADIHEFKITKRNTALFTAVKQVPADLSRFGGPTDGYFNNYSIQEVDLRTGKLVFFWNVLNHVDPADSMIPASSSKDTNNIWDCFHVNSVEEGPNNTILVSMRNTWAVYNIDKKTSNIIWQLGGKKSDFSFGHNANFSWQHDARYRFGTSISLFDNACCASQSSIPKCPAKGLILNLDYINMLATVDKTYYHDPLLYVPTQGNMQELENRNQFIGWGQQPYVSEFAYPGNIQSEPSLNFLYDMQFPNKNISYRAFKNKWVGIPIYHPSLAVKNLYGSVIAYASWNGSTETTAWQILSGTTTNSLSIVFNKVPKSGFETAIKFVSSDKYFQAKALNCSGEIIGTSQIVALDDKDI